MDWVLELLHPNWWHQASRDDVAQSSYHVGVGCYGNGDWKQIGQDVETVGKKTTTVYILQIVYPDVIARSHGAGKGISQQLWW